MRGVDAGAFADEVAALRREVDVLVASCHWGLSGEVFDYMTEIAHTAINAGADIVMGHGPHNPLPMGFHKGKPIYYGLGSFCFHTGHEGIQHGDWVGLMVRQQISARRAAGTSFSFVRHSAANETVICAAADETKVLTKLAQGSLVYGARLEPGPKEVGLHPTSDRDALALSETNSLISPSPAFSRRTSAPMADRGHTPR